MSGAAVGETHWEIQAVDASGDATHPKVIRPGYPWDPSKLVVMEGVVTVGAGEFVDTASELLIAFQGEGGDHAGTQIWSGAFFQDWPVPYDAYFGIEPGDRIRVTGYAAQFIGKSNINEQHSDDPARDFTIEVLGRAGMPAPEVVANVATAVTFDATRLTGGEYYQSRWVRMNNLTVTTPVLWQAGEKVTVSDGTGSMAMKLSAVGDFDLYSAPAGVFDVVGLFDQEPDPLDFAALRTGHYRLWIKRMEHVLPAGGPFLVGAVSRRTHGSAGDFDIEVSESGAEETRSGGPTLVVVTFDRAVTGVGGLDPTDVELSSGVVSGVSANGGELSIVLAGTADAANLTIQFPGIVSTATGAPVVQSLCFGVLRGDVTLNRQVNAFDLNAVRARLGQAVTAANFRYDVAANGGLNAFDLTAVRANLGKQLETACP
jgi:hypothetical protein